MAEIERLTHQKLMTRAARAVGKVDRWGPRGITMVTFDEIEAMAGLLAELGLRPIYEAPPRAATFTTSRTES